MSAVRQSSIALCFLASHVAAQISAGFVTLGPHPNEPQSRLKGAIRVQAIEGTDLLHVTGIISGLQDGVQLGQAASWDIREGFSCESDPGRKFRDVVGSPWNTECSVPIKSNTPCFTVTDATGVATIDSTIQGFSLTDANAVLGRAVVIRQTDGRAIGCGLIEPARGELVTFGR